MTMAGQHDRRRPAADVCGGFAVAAAVLSLSMAIRFDFDSAQLRPKGAAVLDRLASALRRPN